MLVSVQDVCEGLADVSASRCAAAQQPSTNGCRMSAMNHKVKKHRGGCVEEELRKKLPEFHNDGAIAPLLPNIQWMSVKSIISSLMMQSGPKGVHRKINIIECKVWGKGKTKSCNV